MKLFIKIFFIIFSSLSLYACGGGGGGSGASGGGGGGGGMSASSPIAINFTETLSSTRGLVAAYRPGYVGSTPAVHSEEIGFTSEEALGGFRWYQNADTDRFGMVSDTLFSEYNLNVELAPTHINSGPSTDSSNHTLTSTNYTYAYRDSSVGQDVYVTVGIPTNYPNQTWIYWDNTNFTGSITKSYNFAVTGKPLLYASLPSSGTASYTGGMEGLYSRQQDTYNAFIQGDSNFSVSWDSQTISGSFTNITENLNGTINSFNNLTMPLTSINSGNGGIAVFEGDLEGVGFTKSYNTAIHGAFFGSSAESIGGTWEIENDGFTGAGAGYFAAGKN